MRFRRTAAVVFFALAYAILLSLGDECLLNLLSAATAVSVDADPTARRLPGFAAFCLAAGCAALALIVLTVMFNIRRAEELGYTKSTWIVQCALAAALSFPLIVPWEVLFGYLFRTFTE